MLRMMNVLLAALVVCLAQVSVAQAASDCEAKAIDKNGKPLSGAAKAASIKKCEGKTNDAKAVDVKSQCEAEAVGKDGKPLSGAAKTMFMKRCGSERAR